MDMVDPSFSSTSTPAVAEMDLVHAYYLQEGMSAPIPRSFTQPQDPTSTGGHLRFFTSPVVHNQPLPVLNSPSSESTKPTQQVVQPSPIASTSTLPVKPASTSSDTRTTSAPSVKAKPAVTQPEIYDLTDLPDTPPDSPPPASPALPEHELIPVKPASPPKPLVEDQDEIMHMDQVEAPVPSPPPVQEEEPGQQETTQETIPPPSPEAWLLDLVDALQSTEEAEVEGETGLGNASTRSSSPFDVNTLLEDNQARAVEDEVPQEAPIPEAEPEQPVLTLELGELKAGGEHSGAPAEGTLGPSAASREC